MINKLWLVKNWTGMSKEEKAKLVSTFKASKDWDSTKSDLGWTTFLGTLSELVVRNWLISNGSTFSMVQDGLIYQVGDTPVKFKDSCDLEVWSLSKEAFMPSEIKHTSKSIVDTFGTFAVPGWLTTKAKAEGAQWLFVIDNMKYDLENDTYDISNCHLIFKSIYSDKQKAILAEPEEIKRLVEDILLN